MRLSAGIPVRNLRHLHRHFRRAATRSPANMSTSSSRKPTTSMASPSAGACAAASTISMGDWVFGVVGDGNFGRTIAEDDKLNTSLEMPVLGTSRARAGSKWGDTLFYATGGYALAEMQFEPRTSTQGNGMGPWLDAGPRRRLSADRCAVDRARISLHQPGRCGLCLRGATSRSSKASRRSASASTTASTSRRKLIAAGAGLPRRPAFPACARRGPRRPLAPDRSPTGPRGGSGRRGRSPSARPCPHRA